MKFLNIFHYRDSWFALAPDKFAEIQAANSAWTQQQIKAGKITETYLFGNAQGAMCIWNVSSSEDMARTLIEWPTRNYVELEVTPLIESDVATKVMQERSAALKKK